MMGRMPMFGVHMLGEVCGMMMGIADFGGDAVGRTGTLWKLGEVLLGAEGSARSQRVVR